MEFCRIHPTASFSRTAEAMETRLRQGVRELDISVRENKRLRCGRMVDEVGSVLGVQDLLDVHITKGPHPMKYMVMQPRTRERLAKFQRAFLVSNFRLKGTKRRIEAVLKLLKKDEWNFDMQRRCERLLDEVEVFVQGSEKLQAQWRSERLLRLVNKHIPRHAEP